jgi:hypothetical protein
MQFRSIALLALGGLSAATSFAANIYVEGSDAGQTIAAAQPVSTLPGGTTLDAIRGTLFSGADVFKIYLTGGQTFSATTTASTLPYNNFDTELFLFDSAGLGVYANDDSSVSPPQSTLPAGSAFTPSASGIYYLALSSSGYTPVSAGGAIFGAFVATTDVVGATGAGGSAVLSGWNSFLSGSGPYEVVLTGAQFLPSAIPESSTSVLLLGGLAVGAWLRSHRARRAA